MNIRQATPNDLESILSLNENLFAYEKEFTNSYSPEWTRSDVGIEYFSNRISRGIVLVAEQNNAVVGYICGYSGVFEYRTPKECAQIDNMYVRKEHRGQGIGSDLLKAFEKEAKSRSAARIIVGTFVKNMFAQEFYGNNGFKSEEIILEKNF